MYSAMGNTGCPDPIMFKDPDGKCWCPPPYLDEDGKCVNALTKPAPKPAPCPDRIMFRDSAGKCWCPPPYLDQGGKCVNVLQQPTPQIPSGGGGGGAQPQSQTKPQTAGLGNVGMIALAAGGIALLYMAGKQSQKKGRRR